MTSDAKYHMILRRFVVYAHCPAVGTFVIKDCCSSNSVWGGYYGLNTVDSFSHKNSEMNHVNHWCIYIVLCIQTDHIYGGVAQLLTVAANEAVP